MILLCDIDHTISNAAWRDPMIGTESWDEYHTHSPKDEPIPEMVNLVRTLHNAGWHTVGLTTRPEKWRRITMDWLVRHDVQFSELIMRPNDEYRASAIVKVEQVTARFKDLTGAVILDDREDIITAFKAIKVTALHVHARIT